MRSRPTRVRQPPRQPETGKTARKEERRRMLVAEIQELEEVKALVTKGQQLGVLTFGDVSSAVSEVELDESDVEDLYGHLERNGIELVEDIDPAIKDGAAERSDGKRGRRKPKAALDLKPDMTTDS